jgi:hypothetical protein
MVGDYNAGKIDAPDTADLEHLVQTLATLSPIPDPTNHLSEVTGSWETLYAVFGQGRSKAKSHQDDSTLGLQSFRAFPDSPIRVKQLIQEIGESPNTYNNVVLFEAADAPVGGTIIIHGTYEADPKDARRFQVTFYCAEVRGRDGASDAEIRAAFGYPDDFALKREFKPAHFWSDVVYLDEAIRINLGGMGGRYVLERRSAPAITL